MSSYFNEDTGFPEGMPEEMKQYWDIPTWTPRSVSDYHIIQKIGEGAYSEVYKATDKQHKTVALKCLKRDEDGFPVTALREIQLLQQLYHENIVELVDVVSSHSFNTLEKPMFLSLDSPVNAGEGSLYLVFEYCSTDLQQVLNSSYPVTIDQTKLWAKQLFTVLAELAKQGILHRDIKSANILITDTGSIKVADFNLARILKPNIDLTVEVVTRFYRAPEVLLLGCRDIYYQYLALGPVHSIDYTHKIDVWASGCVLAEMLGTGNYLFQGADDIEQYNFIINVCGEPTNATWPGFETFPLMKQITKEKANLPRLDLKPIERNLVSYLEKLSVTDKEAVDVIDKILVLNPQHRLTAEEVIKHPFFSNTMTKEQWIQKYQHKFHSWLTNRDTERADAANRKSGRNKDAPERTGKGEEDMEQPHKRRKVDIITKAEILPQKQVVFEELDYGL